MTCEECLSPLTDTHYQLQLVPGDPLRLFCSLDCIANWCEAQL